MKMLKTYLPTKEFICTSHHMQGRMMKAKSTDDRATKWMRWIARGVGSLVTGFWLFVGIVFGVVDPEPWTLESGSMAGLVISSTLGVLIAWWRDGLGGLILVICAIAHSTFAYFSSGHNTGLAMLISGGPFLLSGILFRASWSRSWKSQSI